MYAIIYDIYLYCILIVIRASARFSNLGRVFLVLVLVVVVGKSELRKAHCILIILIDIHIAIPIGYSYTYTYRIGIRISSIYTRLKLIEKDHFFILRIF